MLTLSLITVLFPDRTGRSKLQLVYDPEKGEVVFVGYSIPRKLDRMVKVETMVAELLALEVPTLDALRAELFVRGAEVRTEREKALTPFVAQLYRNGAEVWRKDWAPDDDEGVAEAIEAVLAEANPDECPGDDMPTVTITLNADGTVTMTHDVEETLIRIVVNRQSPQGVLTAIAEDVILPEPGEEEPSAPADNRRGGVVPVVENDERRLER